MQENHLYILHVSNPVQTKYLMAWNNLYFSVLISLSGINAEQL